MTSVRLYVPAARRRPQPPLPPVDDRRPVAVGTVVWLVLFVLGLIFRGELAEQGREWWIWTALCGAGLGLVGFGYLHRHADRDPEDTRPG